MVSYIVSRVIIVGLGTLYPAYRSYKAIKSKDTKEYVKWMMYWIVFALFTTAEIFIDTLVGFWLPFYYEVKILFLFWILSPTTKGSSILYKKFVHPFFTQHEKEIDGYIEKAKENGYGKLVQYGKKGLDLAADTMMKTAISGQDVLVQQLKRYRSEGSLDQLGRPVPSGPTELSGPTEPVIDEIAPPTDGEQRQEVMEVQRPVETTTTVTESTSNMPRGITQASSLDNIYMRSSMTSDSSLMYDSSTLPRRYYDGTDGTLRSRPSSYYEGSSTLPRYSTTYDYPVSSRPYESTSNLPATTDLTSSYTPRYESSTLPRSRDSSRRYNTRSSRTDRY